MKPDREHLRCFIAPEEWHGAALALREDERHHLLHVLRVRTGERIEVFDGAGRTGVARLDQLDGHSVELRLLEQQTPVRSGWPAQPRRC